MKTLLYHSMTQSILYRLLGALLLVIPTYTSCRDEINKSAQLKALYANSRRQTTSSDAHSQEDNDDEEKKDKRTDTFIKNHTGQIAAVVGIAAAAGLIYAYCKSTLTKDFAKKDAEKPYKDKDQDNKRASVQIQESSSRSAHASSPITALSSTPLQNALMPTSPSNRTVKHDPSKPPSSAQEEEGTKKKNNEEISDSQKKINSFFQEYGITGQASDVDKVLQLINKFGYTVPADPQLTITDIEIDGHNDLICTINDQSCGILKKGRTLPDSSATDDLLVPDQNSPWQYLSKSREHKLYQLLYVVPREKKDKEQQEKQLNSFFQEYGIMGETSNHDKAIQLINKFGYHVKSDSKFEITGLYVENPSGDLMYLINNSLPFWILKKETTPSDSSDIVVRDPRESDDENANWVKLSDFPAHTLLTLLARTLPLHQATLITPTLISTSPLLTAASPSDLNLIRNQDEKQDEEQEKQDEEQEEQDEEADEEQNEEEEEEGEQTVSLETFTETLQSVGIAINAQDKKLITNITENQVNDISFQYASKIHWFSKKHKTIFIEKENEEVCDISAEGYDNCRRLSPKDTLFTVMNFCQPGDEKKDKKDEEKIRFSQAIISPIVTPSPEPRSFITTASPPSLQPKSLATDKEQDEEADEEEDEEGDTKEIDPKVLLQALDDCGIVINSTELLSITEPAQDTRDHEISFRCQAINYWLATSIYKEIFIEVKGEEKSDIQCASYKNFRRLKNTDTIFSAISFRPPGNLDFKAVSFLENPVRIKLKFAQNPAEYQCSVDHEQWWKKIDLSMVRIPSVRLNEDVQRKLLHYLIYDTIKPDNMPLISRLLPFSDKETTTLVEVVCDNKDQSPRYAYNVVSKMFFVIHHNGTKDKLQSIIGGLPQWKEHHTKLVPTSPPS